VPHTPLLILHSQKTGTDNILFEIECRPESFEGIHNGADISLLSQYPQEKEILFPPLTVLTVTGMSGVARSEVSDADQASNIDSTNVSGRAKRPVQLRSTGNGGLVLDFKTGNRSKTGNRGSATGFQHKMPTAGMKGVSERSMAEFGRRRSVSTGTGGQRFHRITLSPTFT
jgi:hypothetical protein